MQSAEDLLNRFTLICKVEQCKLDHSKKYFVKPHLSLIYMYGIFVYHNRCANGILQQ